MGGEKGVMSSDAGQLVQLELGDGSSEMDMVHYDIDSIGIEAEEGGGGGGGGGGIMEEQIELTTAGGEIQSDCSDLVPRDYNIGSPEMDLIPHMFIYNDHLFAILDEDLEEQIEVIAAGGGGGGIVEEQIELTAAVGGGIPSDCSALAPRDCNSGSLDMDPPPHKFIVDIDRLFANLFAILDEVIAADREGGGMEGIASAEEEGGGGGGGGIVGEQIKLTAAAGGGIPSDCSALAPRDCNSGSLDMDPPPHMFKDLDHSFAILDEDRGEQLKVIAAEGEDTGMASAEGEGFTHC